MKLNKSNITTIFLVAIIFIISFSIFYLNTVLNQSSEKKSSVAPRKTKAASISYSKTVGINNNVGSNADLSPTSTPASSDVTNVPLTNSPSPTEILLAYQKQSITPSLSVSVTISPKSVTTTTSLIGTITASPSTAKVKSLPKSGIVQNSLIMFSAAGLFIFFAFLF